MLGNLLMDVNKLSLWKNGAGGGLERVWMMVVVVGWRGGVVLSLSFSLSVCEREASH